MRLHQLTMTAFGPFADTAEVDFDALATGGLFLLTGATGAGKTSVLDAVCFALYGQVPGDRANAKHLRSDHAPPDREPRVVLDLSIGERRFRFTRSPAWTRPKKRGTGTTSSPAHVLVEERHGPEWTALTNRLEDAGLLVGDLLGMNCAQFTQVAMLPQGRFQAFLRASSAERHDVLQKLFRTDRFERVERWLVDRRAEARRASEAGEADVRSVLTRLEESSAGAIPEDWDDALGIAGDEGLIRAWTGSLASTAAQAVESAEAALGTAEAEEKATRQAADELRHRVALAARARQAAAVLADYSATADARAAAEVRLHRHRSAAPLYTLVGRARVARAAADDADRAWAEHHRRLADLPAGSTLPDVPSRSDLTRAQRSAAAGLAAATAFLPRQRELDECAQRTQETTALLTAITAQITTTEAELLVLPDQVRSAEEARERTAAAVTRVADARSQVVALQRLVDAARRHTAATAELDAARLDLTAATEHAQSCREAYLNVREARINGMAAELAGALASGCNCPVCGSTDHPAPARSGSAAIGREDEQTARRVHEDAVVAELGHREKVAGLEAEIAALDDRIEGRSYDALAAELDQAAAAAVAIETDAAAATEAATAAATLRTALADATERLAAHRSRRAAAESELAERTATLAALRSERLTLLAGEASDLEALIAGRTRAVQALDDAAACFDSAAAARADAETAAATLGEAALAAGFADTDRALEALLPDDAATALERDLSDAEARRIAAEAALAEPDVRSAGEGPPPDLEGALAASAAATQRSRSCAAAVATAKTRLERVGELDTDLSAALARWGPLRARHRLTADLASLVEGRSVDNPLRMRLAAYVLAERLRQVVAAANERLSTMTGARFTLEHVLDRGVGEQRGGLSLRVRDDWNGVERDPATLSGGETFVVSLALALGLADTVAHEAGGTDMDTLFIDEGFGSLDADTLEDVMDTLDALRDGGRVVGLVSHVPELRSRITTQLEVAKGRTGSTVRPVLVQG